VVPDVAGWFVSTSGKRPALIQRKKGRSSFHSGRRATARTRNMEQNTIYQRILGASAELSCTIGFSMRTTPLQSNRSVRDIKKLCVFCGSSIGSRAVYQQAAIQFGSELARSGIGLVYGGSRVGLMGVLADSVLGAGGEVIGVMPRALVEKEIAHTALTHLHVVESMHERKALMADLADAFVLLPGGFGSWEEFCEVVTWSQLGMHQKPCGILNVAGYYNPLLSLTSHAVAEGFLRASHQEMVIVGDSSEDLVARLGAAPVPTEVKWVSQKQG
jgi:uncharacterized protein (TIGR00730 family)